MKLRILLALLTPLCPLVAEDAVVFNYRFETDAPAADSAGNGPELSLKDPATFVPEGGREGGGALSLPSPPQADAANYAQVPASALGQLPTEALTVEIDYCPDEALLSSGHRTAFLIDQMYSEKTGIQLVYAPDRRTLTARVGNGVKILTATTRPLTWQAGEWLRLAFSYDAASGSLRIYENGQELAQQSEADFGPLQPGERPLRIGNRIASLYGNATGLYDNLRISRRAAPEAP